MKITIKVLFVKLIGMMVLLLSVGEIFGQQGTIKIIDSKSKEAIPFATVCFQGLKTVTLKQAVTDMDGKVPNDIKETSKIAITYVGYETLLDTIEPGVSTTLLLIPAVMNMSEFVVTGQFKPEKADKSIYKINVINSRQIERKAATNLTDLLSTESHVRISQGGVMGANLSFMGLTGENVKILVDGVPVIGRLDGNIDINQLNLYNVDHVEIIEGPMSVVYGSNAIGGVVNIITKENKNSSFSAFANAYYESVGRYDFNAGGSAHNKNHTYSLDFSRNFFDGYSESDTARSMTWSPKLQYNANGYYLYSTNKVRLKFSMQFFDELIQSYGNLLKPYYETAMDKTFHTVRQTTKVETSYVFSQNRQLSFVGAYSTYNRKYNLYQNDLTVLEKTSAGGDTTVLQSYYLRTLLDSYYFDQKLNSLIGFEGNFDNTEGARIQGNSQQIGDLAGFINLKYNLNSKITLQPGARLIYNTKYQAPLVYSINAKYSPSKNTSLRASFARGFRSPSIKELYLDFVDINHNLFGNQNLKAESSYLTNLNFTYNREMPTYFLNTEITLFYSNLDNMISLVPTDTATMSYSYANVFKFISQGLQLNTTVSFYPKLTLRAGISLTGRKYPQESQNNNEVEIFHYSTDFDFMLTYNFEKVATSLITNFKYSGKYPNLSPNGNFKNEYIDGFPSLDISLVKGFFHNLLNVSCGGKNLFDVNSVQGAMGSSGAHSSSSGSTIVAWGRTAFVKFTYNFKKS